ncbi:WD40-repeat-containing domain protein [Zopfochytrium polystomum]|nr:WD40-repeat-containing domain protein [Zopfochytrium polystomum]
MVRIYLRYEPDTAAGSGVFGVIASYAGNVAYDATGRCAVVPCLEDVAVWDLRRGVLVTKWHDAENRAEVTCIARSPNKRDFAVGYSDGSVRLWNYETGASTTTFTGHKTAVTALAFDRAGYRLASGARDTDVVVWDVLAESGLFRLRGHKDQVTALRFLDTNGDGRGGRRRTRRRPLVVVVDHLVSASKDTTVRFWDLATRHCVETVIAHRGEVCSLERAGRAATLVTGGSEGELRVWRLDLELLASKLESGDGSVLSGWSSGKDVDAKADGAAAAAAGSVVPLQPRAMTSYGVLERERTDRVMQIKIHESGKHMVVQGNDRLIEVYKIRTPEELRRRLARLRNRRKEEKKGAGADGSAAPVVLSATDEFPRIGSHRCVTKVRSIDLSPDLGGGASDAFQILCGLTSNQLEVATAGNSGSGAVVAGGGAAAAAAAGTEAVVRRTMTLDYPGHRHDVRALALSSNDALLASGSHDALKVWSMASRQCVASFASGYVLCAAFVPGNNHVVVGTKEGDIEIFDLASAARIETIRGAHAGPVWALQVWPDRKGVTTGSADHDVKFWEFALRESARKARSAAAKRRVLTLNHTRTLKLADDVLAVAHSADSKLLAVSLLDATVKVFFLDTLQFSLSLYGHKLPALAVDFSTDGELIVTASSDKSIKIWGTEFGDCHRSLLAHADSVMAVRFVEDTHFFVSAGKDGVVKYWDADKFEQILKLEGHHGEVWSLAIGKHGSFFVSGSHDRSIRVWRKTDEQFALEEEKERELEQLYDRAALDPDPNKPNSGAPGEPSSTTATTVPTLSSMRSHDRVLSALSVYEEDSEAYELLRTGADPTATRSPYVVAANLSSQPPEDYVLHVLSQVPAAELATAVALLPFASAMTVLRIVAAHLERTGAHGFLAARVVLEVVEQHHKAVVASRASREVLQRVRTLLQARLREERERVGFNLAGLKVMKREWEAAHAMRFFDDQVAGVPARVAGLSGREQEALKKKAAAYRRAEAVGPGVFGGKKKGGGGKQTAEKRKRS